MENETKNVSTLCGERRHLEALIAECVNRLNSESLEASKLARTGSDMAMFELLRTESSSYRVRLTTLRECLEFHRGWHGC